VRTAVRLGWTGVAALVVAGLVAVGCANQQHTTRPYSHDDGDDRGKLSAARLGDPWEEDSPIDFLDDEQRQAVQQAGLAGWHFEDGERSELSLADREAIEEASQPQGAFSRAADKVAKVGVVLLGVGVTLGMLVAPFFLD
jgi:hypothetical protein